jgi:hypothetical protein
VAWVSENSKCGRCAVHRRTNLNASRCLPQHFGRYHLLRTPVNGVRHPCRLLQLPQPEADALGRPAWSGTSADVSKAYRRMSVLVHPDKFAGQVHRSSTNMSSYPVAQTSEPSHAQPSFHDMVSQAHGLLNCRLTKDGKWWKWPWQRACLLRATPDVCCMLLVQNDKLPDARKAFEALNEAHRRLRDPGTLVSTGLYRRHLGKYTRMQQFVGIPLPFRGTMAVVRGPCAAVSCHLVHHLPDEEILC